MTTLNEILEAASRADAAGDSAGAALLVAEAQKLMQPVKASGVGPENPEFSQVQAPPRADAPGQASAPRPDNFGDTFADATAAPRAAFGAFAGGLTGGESPSRQFFANDPMTKGLPGPVLTGLGAVGDTAMTGLSALGVGYAGAAGLVGEALGGSPTGENKLARDLMMMGEVAVPEMAGVSSTMRMGAGVGKAAAIAEKVPTQRQAVARAADDLGITPSLGMTGKTGGMVAAGLEKVPFSGQIIAKDAMRAVSEVEGAFQAIRGRIGSPLSPDAAGAALQEGLRGFVSQFKDRAGKLFDAVDAKIPKETQVDLKTTQSAIAESKQYFAGNPKLAAKLGLNDWDAVMGEAAQNGVNWQATKQLRSKIGEALGSARGALADEDVGRLKQLYGALTQDMEAAAKAAGPEAYSAWKRANGFYKSGATRIERNLDSLIGKDPASGPNGERAFEAFSAMAKADRAGSDVMRMQRIKSSMPKDAWNTVSASIVERLGKSRPGQQSAAGDAFSPATFLTEWNKLAPDAKKVLLPEDVRFELEKLAKVSEGVRASGLERNMSNTGTVTAGGAIGAGLVTAPTTTLSALAGANITARALTSSPFLRAVNAMARGDAKAISAMAQGKGPFAADAKEIMRLMAADAAAGDTANTNLAPAAARSNR